MNVPVIDKPDATTLMIRRTFDADMQTLWQALTDPETWTHWFGGGYSTPIETSADLRVGGAWRIQLRGNETGNETEIGGTYSEIDPPRRLVFSWAWTSEPERVSQVTYALSPTESTEQTTLILTHERLANSEARDNHGRGWSASLERLEVFLDGKAAI